MDDVTLNQIDYKWVDQTDDSKKLKKALKLLKDDGGYFPDLERHIEDKLVQIDKKFKYLVILRKEHFQMQKQKKYQQTK
jgi:hypothetical protein